MSPVPQYRQLPGATKKNIRLSLFEGMAYAVMVGAAESYFTAFAVFLSASAFQLGVLGAIPPFLSSLTQIASLFLFKRFSRRQLLTFSALLQSLVLVPLMLIPFFEGPGITAGTYLIVCAALYSAAAGLMAPAWSSLIGDLIPAKIRGTFFGRRNQGIGFATLLTMLFAGLILSVFEIPDSHTPSALGFLFVFLTAAVARAISACLLTRHDDPPFTSQPEELRSFFQFAFSGENINFRRFVVYAGAMLGANAFAAPYFAAYMLQVLNFPYSLFSLMTAAYLLAQIIFNPLWGRLIDRSGCRWVILLAGCGVTINPFLWLISSNPYWIFFIQTVSGITWSGFNLAAATFLFDSAPPEDRPRCAAFQGLVQGSFVLIGSLAGAITVQHLPAYAPLLQGEVPAASNYLPLFCLSGMLRFSFCLLLLKRIQESRKESTA